MSEQKYLGDAVYASFDGWQIELRTGDGNNQVIYLEPSTYWELTQFAEKCWKRGEPPEPDAEPSGTGCWQCEGKGCPDCLPHQPVRT